MLQQTRARPPEEDYGREFYIETTEKLIPAQKSEKEAEFIARHLQLDKDHELLDVPCGYGRLALKLASRVKSVTCVDRSRSNLDELRHKIKQTGLSNVIPVQAKMQSFSSKMPFDAAIVTFASFGLLRERENEKFAAMLGRSVRMGGRIYLDVLNRTYFRRHLPKTNYFRAGAYRIQDKLFWVDEARIQSIREYTTPRGGRRTIHEVQVYTLDEVASMLLRHGYRVEKTYSDFIDTPYHDEADKILLFGVRVRT